MSSTLNIPKFAFGTAYSISPEATSEGDFTLLLQEALKLGCRHIDCAPLYGTHRLVGQVIKDSSSLLSRSELFITSKLPVNMMRKDNIRRSLNKSLDELQLSYLDLFLIHAPFATQYQSDDIMYAIDTEGNCLLDESENVLETAWKELSDLKSEGLIRYIGVSNVNAEQLNRLNKIHHVDVVQNEFHLYHQDRDVVQLCKRINTHYEAYAAFGSPKKAKLSNKPVALNESVVEKLANTKNISKGQVIIQWLNQKSISFVIRSDNIDQLKENLDALKLPTLSKTHLDLLDCLDQNIRLFLYTHHNGIDKHREYPFSSTKS